MEYTGKIIKISGPVIDIRFDNGKIPPINALVTVAEYAKHAEIAAHLGGGVARAQKHLRRLRACAATLK